MGGGGPEKNKFGGRPKRLQNEMVCVFGVFWGPKHDFVEEKTI